MRERSEASKAILRHEALRGEHVRGGPLTDENAPMIPDGIQHLFLAILARAVRDLRNADPCIQAEARRWLVEDALCAEICESLGYSLSTLHRTIGLLSPSDW